MPEISSHLSRVSGSATAQIFAKAKQLEAQGVEVIHFEIGQPDFLPVDPILEATKQAIDEGAVQYTVSKGIPELREAISEYYRTFSPSDPLSEVTVTAGGKLAIFASLWSVVNPGDNVIVLEPSWVSYADIVSSLGAEVRFLPTDALFTFDQSELRRLIDEKTRAVIVNSPSNPSGAILGERGMTELFNVCAEHDLLLISDEMYNEYVYGENTFFSLAGVRDWKDHGVVVNGLSKTFSMTGYRIGYAITNEEISRQVNKVMQLTASCAPKFAQVAGVVAFQNIELMRERIRSIMLPRRELVIELMGDLPGIQFSEPQGAIYAWFKVNGVSDSFRWGAELLEKQGVAVTPGRAFGPSGEGHIRISYATPKDKLIRGFGKIKEFLSSQ